MLMVKIFGNLDIDIFTELKHGVYDHRAYGCVYVLYLAVIISGGCGLWQFF